MLYGHRLRWVACPWRRYEQREAAVIPLGITLSLVVVLLLLYTGWRSWSMVYAHRVGVKD